MTADPPKLCNKPSAWSTTGHVCTAYASSGDTRSGHFSSYIGPAHLASVPRVDTTARRHAQPVQADPRRLRGASFSGFLRARAERATDANGGSVRVEKDSSRSRGRRAQSDRKPRPREPPRVGGVFSPSISRIIVRSVTRASSPLPSKQMQRPHGTTSAPPWMSRQHRRCGCHLERPARGPGDPMILDASEGPVPQTTPC